MLIALIEIYDSNMKKLIDICSEGEIQNIDYLTNETNEYDYSMVYIIE